ncbi:hypothetical protein SAMN05444000_1128 [Shimia gijangensis]|uniref:Uncharacterized protein n=1 Tax=Shimia gijangensis TaxID=1470563 RepID=A0A1M6LI86_9RHOB|nr:hypothetical protein SAMN05444000_1128 [Shimia gijangensis]
MFDSRVKAVKEGGSEFLLAAPAQNPRELTKILLTRQQIRKG